MLALTLLIGLLLANALTFVATDLARPAVWAAAPIFILAWVVAVVAVRGLRWRRRRVDPPQATTIVIACALALMLLPRASFPFEPFLDREVETRMDDFARLSELIAMTQAERYPLVSPIHSGYRFSFYYAPLHPAAVLYTLVPALTLKAALFWANFGYYVLFLLAARELAARAVATRAQLVALVAMLALFNGLGWLANLTLHGTLRAGGREYYVWWQGIALAPTKQVRSIHDAMVMAVHHAAGLAAVVSAWGVARWTLGGLRKYATVAGLLVAALYASPFVLAPALLMMLVHSRAILRRLARYWAIAAVSIVCLIPMRLFFGKPDGVEFLLRLPTRVWGAGAAGDALINLVLHVTAVPIIEMAGLPLLALLLWPRLTRVERWYVAAGWLFFLSTYALEFSAGNPYAMRGMLVPELVFLVVVIRRLPISWDRIPRAAGVALVAFASIGACLHAYALFPWSYFRAPTPGVMTRVAKDRSIKTIQPSLDETERMRQYNAERPMRPSVPLEQMADWERELISKK